MSEPKLLEDSADFSVVLGGPIYQFFRRSHLTGDALELLHRRLLAITLLAWLPLLLIASLSAAFGGGGLLAFFQDVEVHVRFLVALPVLVGAELLVHSRLRPAVRRFVERNIVRPEDRPRFLGAVESAVRLRDSVAAELVLLLLVYTLGPLLWQSRAVIESPTWYTGPGGRWQLTPAGYWYVFVSIPVLQFILLRWYWRLFIWFRFLFQVSRLDLHLFPAHPDRCGALGFLGKSSYSFGPILFAQGAMLAGVVASRVLYRNEPLLSFKLQIGAFVGFFVLVILGPLLMFTPRMAREKRRGLAEYGLLAQRYVESFERRWVHPEAVAGEDFLGSADVQSLADMGNSYALVRDMRSVPFGLEDITRLAAATAAPFTPLLLTILSPEELILRIIKVVF